MALEQPDPAILRRAQRGDGAAFETIVRAYERPVFNYVLRAVGDRSFAEDITQEVFLRIYQGLPKFNHQSKFTTWMFQVTKNKMMDELRTRERRPRMAISIDDVTPFPVHDPPMERAETIDALWIAIAALPYELRTALLLRDLVGLSYNEIAESQHITLATVKWRIYTGREQVQISLSRIGLGIPTSARRATNATTAA